MGLDIYFDHCQLSKYTCNFDVLRNHLLDGTTSPNNITCTIIYITDMLSLIANRCINPILLKY